MKMQQKANWVLGMTCLHRGIAPMDDIPSVTALHQDAAKLSLTNMTHICNQYWEFASGLHGNTTGSPLRLTRVRKSRLPCKSGCARYMI